MIQIFYVSDSNVVDVETSNKKCKNLFQKLFWPFTVKLNCFSDFKNCCSQSKEQFFIIGFSKRQFLKLNTKKVDQISSKIMIGWINA